MRDRAVNTDVVDEAIMEDVVPTATLTRPIRGGLLLTASLIKAPPTMVSSIHTTELKRLTQRLVAHQLIQCLSNKMMRTRLTSHKWATRPDVAVMSSVCAS